MTNAKMELRPSSTIENVSEMNLDRPAFRDIPALISVNVLLPINCDGAKHKLVKTAIENCPEFFFFCHFLII